MKLPLRFRILHLLSQHDALTVREVMDALRDEYGNDGQFKPAIIEGHLMSMKAVGLLEIADVDLDDNGKLVQHYRITDYGKSRLKYLPQGWK